MEPAKEDKNKKQASKSSKSQESVQKTTKTSQNEDSGSHVGGGRDTVPESPPRPEQQRDDDQSLVSLVGAIASITKTLNTVQSNQDELVSVMKAAGAEPFFGKGKGGGEAESPTCGDDLQGAQGIQGHTRHVS